MAPSTQSDADDEEEPPLQPAREMPELFVKAVETALKHVRRPAVLGASSPLAMPYLLSGRIPHNTPIDTPMARGKALAQLLRKSAQALPPETQSFLAAAFFERQPAKKVVGVAQALSLRESAYYRRRGNALALLAARLHRELQPALRREFPARAILRGRERRLAECMRLLVNRNTLALTGPGGIGKTSFGVDLTHHWQKAFAAEDRRLAAFWYTVRPGLNDNLSSFVFTLADFLREHGIVNLWAQLVAEHGQLPDYTPGLIRHALHALASRRPMPLFCIDEADALDRDQERHKPLIAVIEELKGKVPLMLIGQRLVVEPDRHETLAGLDADAVRGWLQERQLELTDERLTALLAATGGNPALLSLAMVLLRLDEPFDQLLQRIFESPTIGLLLDRVWQHLDGVERDLLMRLSVHRNAVPRTLAQWAVADSVWDRLIDHRLVERDAQDAVHLPWHVREFVRARVPLTVARVAQREAGDMRASMGQFTEAAHHYIEAGEPDAAVHLWWISRYEEKERGQAQAAHAIFEKVSVEDLASDDARQALGMIQAFLAELLGHSAELGPALDQDWSNAPWARGAVERWRALGHERGGQLEHAERAYRRGIQAALNSVPMQLVDLHLGLGRMFVDRSVAGLAEAEAEALRASAEIERYTGIVAERRSRYEAAREHYMRAASIAERVARDGKSMRARIQADLGILDWKLGRGESAVRLLRDAEQAFREQDDWVRASFCQMNLAAAHIVARQPAEALRVAEAGLAAVEPMRNDVLTGGYLSNAAEACLHLGRLDDAEAYAGRCVRLEEPAHAANAYIVLAHIRRLRGQPQQAEGMFAVAIGTARETEDDAAEAAARRGMGELFLGMHARPRALQALGEARGIYVRLCLEHEIAATDKLIALAR